MGSYVIDACQPARATGHKAKSDYQISLASANDIDTLMEFANSSNEHHEKGRPYLHVSFETANPNAIRFWPKYFKPAIRSVRRTINKDADTNE